jgi:hypothetical protein
MTLLLLPPKNGIPVLNATGANNILKEINKHALALLERYGLNRLFTNDYAGKLRFNPIVRDHLLCPDGHFIFDN